MFRRKWNYASRVCRAFIFGCFCALVIAIFSPVILFYLPSAIAARLRWKRFLKSRGRLLSLQAFDSQSRSGTLIVNQPDAGWGKLECWWTPDLVLETCPAPMPTWEERREFMEGTDESMPAHPFDEWCWWQYISPDTGTAILLATRRGDVIARRLQLRSPNLRIAQTCTFYAAVYDDLLMHEKGSLLHPPGESSVPRT